MVAILLSTFNGEKYLREQIDSILNQNYTDWKLYIRDDLSTDNTVHIIHEYLNQYPKKIYMINNWGKNIGPARSFINLLENIDSEYYMFCDQDDFWYESKVAKSLDLLLEYEKLYPNKPIIVHTDLEVVDKNLSTINSSLWNFTSCSQIINNPEFISIHSTVIGCTMIFNKLCKYYSLPISSEIIMHDFWLTIKTIKNGGHVIPLSLSLIKYRQHDTNVCGIKAYNHSYMNRIKNIKYSFITNKLKYKVISNVLNISLITYIKRKILIHKLMMK